MNARLLPRRVTRRDGARVTQLLLLFAALMALLLGGFTTMSLASHAPPDGNPGHCPDHQDVPKDEDPEAGGVSSLEVDGTTVWLHYSDDLKTVEFYADEEGTEPLAVDFCVKAGNDNSGEHTGTEFTVDWTNNGGQIPEISYVVVYGIADADDCPGENGGISLAHSDGSDDPATNEPGDPHSVTATVTDEDGNPCPDANVRFEVDGDGNPTPSEGSGTTDEDGEADFEFNNDEEGTNTITACTNADGSLPDDCADADHSDTLTKIWEAGVEAGFFCRSDTVTLGLGGDDVLNLFEANQPSDPCETDADGLLVALSPLLGDGGLGLLNDKNQIELSQDGFGSLTLDLLWARTEAGDDSAHADSGVLFFVANDGTADQIILEVGTSENSTDADCNTTTMATLLAITLAGERFEVTGGNVVLIDPALDDLVIIRIEDGNQGGADEGPDDTGAQALDVGALMNNITATVADSESGCTD